MSASVSSQRRLNRLFTATVVSTTRVLKNVMSDGLSRQIFPKKRSLWVINEHFEGEFNALRPSAIVFQHPARRICAVLVCMLTALTVACATNTIEIPQKSDAAIEITTTIKAALVGAPDIDAASVRVTLANDTIVVSGFVSSESERMEVIRLTEMHARGYPVIDEVTVKAPLFE